jgi:hypothetical protein
VAAIFSSVMAVRRVLIPERPEPKGSRQDQNSEGKDDNLAALHLSISRREFMDRQFAYTYLASEPSYRVTQKA